jgi:hypothetical protein
VRKLVVAALLLPLVLLTGCGKGDGRHFCTGTDSGGCTKVPADATKAAFCTAGSTFSEANGFANGLKAAKALAAVGTPSDIDASARAGFVELVERMVDAENGPDFRRRTRNLSDSEKRHLLDLDSYIRETCANGAG